MGKYTPLETYLRAIPAAQKEVTLTHAQIERILNDNLPPSASKHRAWWSNQKEGPHPEKQSWLNAGWNVDSVNLTSKRVRFRRAK